MLITIDAGPTVALEDPDDFTEFSIVRRAGVADDDLATAVAALGRTAGPNTCSSPSSPSPTSPDPVPQTRTGNPAWRR